MQKSVKQMQLQTMVILLCSYSNDLKVFTYLGGTDYYLQCLGNTNE